MPYLRTADGTSLYYTDWGEGEPVVFCHAWAFNSDQWYYQIPPLVDAGLRVVAYDRRGHGRSDTPGHGYDFDTSADDLAALAEHLDLRRSTLVGHSTGAGCVVRYVGRHGAGRVARVVLVAPVTPLMRRSTDNPQGIDPAVFAAGARALRVDVAQWAADNAAPFFGCTPVATGLADWTMRQVISVPLQVLAVTAAACQTTDTADDLRACTVPALVIHGDLDVSAPLEITGVPVTELLPNSQVVIYEGPGHGLDLTYRERLAQDILAFINTGTTGARGHRKKISLPA